MGHAVECAPLDFEVWVGIQGLDPVEHFCRGFPRKGDEEDLVRVETLTYEPCGASGEHFGFAAAGPREYETRTERGGHNGELLCIKVEGIGDGA